tara:strand:- start:248 stop:457 length:210 start_codon:yes stop_codon:yes gene_type:complete
MALVQEYCFDQKIKSVFLIPAMNAQLHKAVLATETNFINGCNCDHCIGIRKQQQESELKWLEQHQLFDR